MYWILDIVTIVEKPDSLNSIQEGLVDMENHLWKSWDASRTKRPPCGCTSLRKIRRHLKNDFLNFWSLYWTTTGFSLELTGSATKVFLPAKCTVTLNWLKGPSFLLLALKCAYVSVLTCTSGFRTNSSFQLQETQNSCLQKFWIAFTTTKSFSFAVGQHCTASCVGIYFFFDEDDRIDSARRKEKKITMTQWTKTTIPFWRSVHPLRRE